MLRHGWIRSRRIESEEQVRVSRADVFTCRTSHPARSVWGYSIDSDRVRTSTTEAPPLKNWMIAMPNASHTPTAGRFAWLPEQVQSSRSDPFSAAQAFHEEIDGLPEPRDWSDRRFWGGGLALVAVGVLGRLDLIRWEWPALH